jgi:hypothetical protein
MYAFGGRINSRAFAGFEMYQLAVIPELTRGNGSLLMQSLFLQVHPLAPKVI